MQQKHAYIMQHKNIIKLTQLICIFLLFILVLSGCSDDSNADKLTVENATVNEYVEGDEIPTKNITKKLWEKEYSQLETKDVTIDANWKQYICVDSLFVPAKKFTDISELTNQFINNDDFGSITKYYSAVGVESTLTSIGSADAEYAQSHLYLNTVATDNNAYITSITMRSIVNQNEGGLDNLSKQKSSEGKLSLGNTYSDVIEIIGNGTQLTSVTQDTLIITNYRYTDENVSLELQFTKTAEMADDDAVLTQIKWTPQLLKKALKQFLYQEQPTVEN